MLLTTGGSRLRLGAWPVEVAAVVTAGRKKSKGEKEIVATLKSSQAARKLNRWQKMLTAEQARALPPLYANDGQGLNAVAQVKFFCGPFTWFATEFNAEDGLFFGLVVHATDCPDGELGYFAADEICARQVPERLPAPAGRIRIIPVVERDLHFAPKSLLAAFRELTGRDHPSTAAAGKLCGDGTSCDCAATAEVNGAPVCDRHNPENF